MAQTYHPGIWENWGKGQQSNYQPRVSCKTLSPREKEETKGRSKEGRREEKREGAGGRRIEGRERGEGWVDVYLSGMQLTLTLGLDIHNSMSADSTNS